MTSFIDPFSTISEHFAQDDIPFLWSIDEGNEASIEEIDLDIENLEIKIKQRDAHLIPTLTLEQIKKQVEILLIKRPEEYALWGARRYIPKNLSKDNSSNAFLWGQKGLFSVADIPAFDVIGIYAGRYIKDIKTLQLEYQERHPVLIDRYMHACDLKGVPCISAYGCGNYMSYINDWRPENIDQIKDIDQYKQNHHNVISAIGICGGHKFIFYITIEPVWCNDEFLTDYGQGYWEREQYIRESLQEAIKKDP